MTVTGYVILEVHDVNAMSLNSDDSLVMIVYGKDANDLWGMGFDKWYWDDSTTIGGNFNATMLDFNDTLGAGSSVFGTGDLHISGLSIWIYGKTAKNVVIGPSTKATVVKSFKGTIISENSKLTTASGYNDASGSLVLTLDMANTKYANTITIDQVNVIHNKIIADLQKKGFVSLP
jgi:hypothetical protein